MAQLHGNHDKNSSVSGSDIRDASDSASGYCSNLGIRSNNDVDHINHDTLNNTGENLREVTHAQNQQNKKGPYSNSKSGIRGVVWDKKKLLWIAQIMPNGKFLYRKMFKNIEDANIAVKGARKILLPYATN